MSTEMNKRVLVRPLCNILAVASCVHYIVRAYLWELANELHNAEIKCTESDEAKETVQSTFDINQYTTLYRVAREVTRICPYGLDPKSHTGIQSAMNTQRFNPDLKVDFDKAMGSILELAEELLRANWRRYLHRAKDMQQHYVWHRTELLQLYPCYLDKKGRADNNIPDPKPHTIAPLIMIDELLSPLNNRGLFAKLIITEGGPANGMTKGFLLKELEKCGWISSGTNASTATLPVHEVDPRTGGNYRSEPHEPHGKVVLPAAAA